MSWIISHAISAVKSETPQSMHASRIPRSGQYEQALTNGARIAGPAAEALLHGKLDDATVHWLQTNFLKTELELGHCLRLPAEGPCECDLVLNCPKFLTTSEYAPRLRAARNGEGAHSRCATTGLGKGG